MEYVKNHDSEEIAKHILSYFPDISMNDLTSIVDRYKGIDAWFDNTYISEDDFNHIQEIMENAGQLTEKAPYEKLVNTKYSK